MESKAVRFDRLLKAYRFGLLTVDMALKRLRLCAEILTQSRKVAKLLRNFGSLINYDVL